MTTYIRLQSKKEGEIDSFLSKFYSTNLDIKDHLTWKKKFSNPVEMSDLIGVFIDNFDDFDIKMWISLDKDIFVQISKQNANEIIRYLYERYPY